MCKFFNNIAHFCSLFLHLVSVENHVLGYQPFITVSTRVHAFILNKYRCGKHF